MSVVAGFGTRRCVNFILFVAKLAKIGLTPFPVNAPVGNPGSATAFMQHFHIVSPVSDENLLRSLYM